MASSPLRHSQKTRCSEVKTACRTAALSAAEPDPIFRIGPGILHGLHAHRIHTEQGSLCVRKTTRTQKYSQQQQGRSTELATNAKVLFIYFF